jgi:hypothetical protein
LACGLKSSEWVPKAIFFIDFMLSIY